MTRKLAARTARGVSKASNKYSGRRMLNSRLYHALEQLFGHVIVANEGEAMLCKYAKVRVGEEPQLVIDSPGEHYRVNCPECTDTRHRLYINHRWGVVDETGRNNLFLMVCHNENCYEEYRLREELYYVLSGMKHELDSMTTDKLAAPTAETKVMGPMELPSSCVPITSLPVTHQAVRYLSSRLYDVQEIATTYGLQYCPESYMYSVRERIIAPLYAKGNVIGYQARLPYDCDWKAENIVKWWTAKNTPRSRWFYNHEQASKYATGVIVEGPADVWSFGPWCHAVLGSSVSKTQQDLFIKAHRSGSGVLLLDPEEMDKPRTRATIEAMQGKLKRGFCGVVLPSGRDPGSLSSEFLREYVSHEAAKQGVKTAWRKSKKRKSTGDK